MDALLREKALLPWHHIQEHLQGSKVFLDAGSTQIVAACPGVSALLDLGAAAICDLDDVAGSALLCDDGSIQGVCVVVTTYLDACTPAVLQVLQRHASAPRCTVICSVTPEAHAASPASRLGSDAFADAAYEWREACAQRGHLCPPLQVHHLPLHISILGPAGFVLSPHGAAMRSCGEVLRAAVLGGDFATDSRQTAAADVDSDSDAGGSPPGALLLAHELAGVRAQLGKKCDVYAVGAAAAQVADALIGLPAPPGPLGGPGGGSAALLLVDRGADLGAVLGPGAGVLDLAALAGGASWPTRGGAAFEAWWLRAARGDAAGGGADAQFAADARHALGEDGATSDSADYGAVAARLAAAADAAADSGGFLQMHALSRCARVHLDAVSARAATPALCAIAAAQSPGAVCQLLLSAFEENPSCKELGAGASEPSHATNGRGAPPIAADAHVQGLLRALAFACVRQSAFAPELRGWSADPVAAFADVYGDRIVDALAAALERSLRARSCTLQQLLAAPPPLRGRPVCEGRSPQRSLYRHSRVCASRASFDFLPSSDDDEDSADEPCTSPDADTAANGLPTSSRDCRPHAGRCAAAGAGGPVGESSEPDDWGAAWDAGPAAESQPARPAAAPAADPTAAAWAAEGWGADDDDDGWFAMLPQPAAPLQAPSDASSPQFASPAASSSFAGSDSAGGVHSLEGVLAPATSASGQGSVEVASVSTADTAKSGRRPVVKRVVKKVVKKLVPASQAAAYGSAVGSHDALPAAGPAAPAVGDPSAASPTPATGARDAGAVAAGVGGTPPEAAAVADAPADESGDASPPAEQLAFLPAAATLPGAVGESGELAIAAPRTAQAGRVSPPTDGAASCVQLPEHSSPQRAEVASDTAVDTTAPTAASAVPEPISQFDADLGPNGAVGGDETDFFADGAAASGDCDAAADGPVSAGAGSWWNEQPNADAEAADARDTAVSASIAARAVGSAQSRQNDDEAPAPAGGDELSASGGSRAVGVAPAESAGSEAPLDMTAEGPVMDRGAQRSPEADGGDGLLSRGAGAEAFSECLMEGMAALAASTAPADESDQQQQQHIAPAAGVREHATESEPSPGPQLAVHEPSATDLAGQILPPAEHDGRDAGIASDAPPAVAVELAGGALPPTATGAEWGDGWGDSPALPASPAAAEAEAAAASGLDDAAAAVQEHQAEWPHLLQTGAPAEPREAADGGWVGRSDIPKTVAPPALAAAAAPGADAPSTDAAEPTADAPAAPQALVDDWDAEWDDGAPSQPPSPDPASPGLRRLAQQGAGDAPATPPAAPAPPEGPRTPGGASAGWIAAADPAPTASDWDAGWDDEDGDGGGVAAARARPPVSAAFEAGFDARHGGGTGGGASDSEAARFARQALSVAVQMARACSAGLELRGGAGEAASGDPLLAWLARAIMDADPRLSSVKHVTSALSSMFATGFGAIGLGSGQVKLSGYGCVVLFVVGGVTLGEVAAVADEARGRAAARALGARLPTFLVGGTSVATGASVAGALAEAARESP